MPPTSGSCSRLIRRSERVRPASLHLAFSREIFKNINPYPFDSLGQGGEFTIGKVVQILGYIINLRYKPLDLPGNVLEGKWLVAVTELFQFGHKLQGEIVACQQILKMLVFF